MWLLFSSNVESCFKQLFAKVEIVRFLLCAKEQNSQSLSSLNDS